MELVLLRPFGYVKQKGCKHEIQKVLKPQYIKDSSYIALNSSIYIAFLNKNQIVKKKTFGKV